MGEENHLNFSLLGKVSPVREPRCVGYMRIKLRGNSFVFLNCPPVHSKWSGADLKAAGPSSRQVLQGCRWMADASSPGAEDSGLCGLSRGSPGEGEPAGDTNAP